MVTMMIISICIVFIGSCNSESAIEKTRLFAAFIALKSMMIIMMIAYDDYD